MVKIACWAQNALGVDQDGDLWIWGDHLKMEAEERALFFDFPQGPYSPGLPLKVKWFSERGYKIVDI